MTTTILPANPGEAMLTIRSDERDTWSTWERVIAWRIDAKDEATEDCEVRAIGLDGSATPCVDHSAAYFDGTDAHSVWFYAPHKQLHNAYLNENVRDEAEALKVHRLWSARARAAKAEGAR